MASEYSFLDDAQHLGLNKAEESTEQRNLSSDTATGLACNASNDFDCNICLEFVQDPVVTLCGHLYCWPCIYKWIRFKNTSSQESNQRPRCPVCNAEVSVAAIVPLYGRGKDITASDREASRGGRAIPKRPSAPIGCDMSAGSARQVHQHRYQPPEPHPPQHSPYTATFLMPRLGGTNAFQPIIEIFGELVSSRMSGHSMSTGFDRSDSYNVAEASTPRVRRQLAHADQSLSRLCFFFLCCVMMCLLLF
uniref:E3 ubiquitin-protein ligase RMA n=1 Tax=Kalanchoe fedtschenkoi TaxID=63787 RepID=A0A7N0TK95_KALFE